MNPSTEKLRTKTGGAPTSQSQAERSRGESDPTRTLGAKEGGPSHKLRPKDDPPDNPRPALAIAGDETVLPISTGAGGERLRNTASSLRRTGRVERNAHMVIDHE